MHLGLGAQWYFLLPDSKNKLRIRSVVYRGDFIKQRDGMVTKLYFSMVTQCTAVTFTSRLSNNYPSGVISLDGHKLQCSRFPPRPQSTADAFACSWLIVAMPADAMELYAAEALLELHFGPSRSSKDMKVRVKDAERVLVSGLLNPDTPSTAAHSSSVIHTEPIRLCGNKHRDENLEINHPSSYESSNAHKTADTYKDIEPRPRQTGMVVHQEESNTERAPQSPVDGEGSLNIPINLSRKKTCTQGNLTNDGDLSTGTNGVKKDKMGVIVSVLYASINSLEMQLEECQKNLSSSPKYIQQNNICSKSMKCNSSSFNTIDTTAIESDDSDDEWLPEDYIPSKQILIQVVKPRNKDMVPIGEGHALVPARLLKQIDWSSYTGATRKLLTAVFSRRVLATHSLTGKPSPAFPGKPAKKRLDSDLVNDIVQTVVERCGVPESVVRTSITTKCADESKMYRSRQQQMKKHSYQSNHENVPPCRYDDSSSE